MTESIDFPERTQDRSYGVGRVHWPDGSWRDVHVAQDGKWGYVVRSQDVDQKIVSFTYERQVYNVIGFMQHGVEGEVRLSCRSRPR